MVNGGLKKKVAVTWRVEANTADRESEKFGV